MFPTYHSIPQELYIFYAKFATHFSTSTRLLHLGRHPRQPSRAISHPQDWYQYPYREAIPCPYETYSTPVAHTSDLYGQQIQDNVQPHLTPGAEQYFYQESSGISPHDNGRNIQHKTLSNSFGLCSYPTAPPATPPMMRVMPSIAFLTGGSVGQKRQGSHTPAPSPKRLRRPPNDDLVFTVDESVRRVAPEDLPRRLGNLQGQAMIYELLQFLCALNPVAIHEAMFERALLPQKRWSETGDLEELTLLQVCPGIKALESPSSYRQAIGELLALGFIKSRPGPLEARTFEVASQIRSLAARNTLHDKYYAWRFISFVYPWVEEHEHL